MSKRTKIVYYATAVHAKGECRLMCYGSWSLLNQDSPLVGKFKTREKCEEAARAASEKCAALGEPVSEVLVFAMPVTP